MEQDRDKERQRRVWDMREERQAIRDKKRAAENDPEFVPDAKRVKVTQTNKELEEEKKREEERTIEKARFIVDSFNDLQLNSSLYAICQECQKLFLYTSQHPNVQDDDAEEEHHCCKECSDALNGEFWIDDDDEE